MMTMLAFAGTSNAKIVLVPTFLCEKEFNEATGNASPRAVAATKRRLQVRRTPLRRFEHLALEYNSDEIGDLGEEDMEAPDGTEVGAFGGLLDEFLAVHATPGHEHEGGQAYHSAAEAATVELGAAADEDAAVAITKVRALSCGRSTTLHARTLVPGRAHRASRRTTARPSPPLPSSALRRTKTQRSPLPNAL